MKIKQLTLLFIITSLSLYSQENTNESSIETQFDKVYKSSTTYQTYKVIAKSKYLNLKTSVLDSLKRFTEIIDEKERSLTSEKDSVQLLKRNLLKVQNELKVTLRKEDSISFLGIQVSKLVYNLIMWLIVIVLGASLAYFTFKYYRSHVLTREAEDNLENVESEFEIHRKKSLEREQKLRRQLQDEINKQKTN
ncbi:hypothetical protein [Polaribacter sp.]|uniref:hypothetical protein n=1 Tax=Polaribacter sp. TaxID=1920175 RepID=UPI0025DC92F9|nr:hypothetical protein [Polaribacter sp.]